ncbi:MAG: clostripain-related cysteine peptidase [Elusimicrobiota bacterium]|nr:clostripain-related cysteine peptidase [Elusimicrobiota bacterium]
MKKLLSALAVAFLFSLSVNAAELQSFGLDSLNASDISGILPTPVAGVAAAPAVRPSKAGPKEWTVMFYSTTKDQLRYALMWQLLEMKKTGSTAKVNVVVQAAMPVRGLDGKISTPTVRIALGAAGSAENLDPVIEAMFASGTIDESTLAPFASDIVSRTNNTDTGNWRNVADFTKWAKAAYPAKRYAFVIYGHGNGIFDPKKSNKGTLTDTDTGNYVTVPEMRLMMAETGKVDLFVMTSCIMQMAEVAWQIKDYTDVIVGSSELMSAVGYDLGGMLQTLNANPGIRSEQLGVELADGYIARVKSFKIPGGHASVLLTSRLNGLVEKLNAWVDAEMVLKDKAAVSSAVNEVARFDIFGITQATSAVIARKLSISGDLYDFVSLMTAGTPQDTPERRDAALKGRALMDFIANDLLYKYSYTGVSNTGFDYSRAHGLAVHIPPIRVLSASGSLADYEKMLETLYWDLPFAKETKWGGFLSWIYGRDAVKRR